MSDGPDVWTDDDRECVETALRAVDAGNAGHWPTVAGWLAAEVRRLRALEAAHPVEPASRLTPEEADRILDQHFAPVRGIAEGGGEEPETRESLATLITDEAVEDFCREAWPKFYEWDERTQAVFRRTARHALELRPLLGLQQVPTAVAELAADWKQSADEDERYLNRAHASEIHDVYASIRLNREHAAELLALFSKPAAELCGKPGPRHHGSCVFAPGHHDDFHNGGEWTSHADRGGWTWNDQPVEEGS